MRDAAKRMPAEIDAMSAAVAFLGYCLRNNYLLPGEKKPRVSIFQPAHPSNELADFYKNDLDKLAKLAREGDIEADYWLRIYLLDEAKNGPLTQEKHDVLGWLLLAPQPKLPARRGRNKLQDRNFLIATAVLRINTAFGFPPTRNRDGRGVSASQIVAMALTKLGMKMTERAVEEIWNDNKGVVERIAFVPPVPFK
jgi:hypothetical protein